MERLYAAVNNIREQFGVWSSRVLIVLVLSFLFFIAGGGVSHNERWRIGRVDISGTSTVSEDVMRSLVRQKLVGNYFFVYARENSRLFPKTEIEQMLLETFPRLSSISVNRTDNHTLSVLAQERKPYALWCGEEPSIADSPIKECWFIDDAGFVFDRAPAFSRGVYVEVYGKLAEKNLGESLRGSLSHDRFTAVDVFAKLVHESIGELLRMTIKPEGELEVAIRNSSAYPFLSEVSIRFKDESSPKVLIKSLLAAIPTEFPGNLALKKKLLYIDMRFGNKVIFGFEN